MTGIVSPRARTIGITLLLLAFVGGAAAGIAGRSMIDRTDGPRIRASLDMSRVLDALHLTAEQRRQADAIVHRSAPRSQAIMIELAERLRAVADSVDVELRALLTPAQLARLDSMRTDSRIVMKRKVMTPGGTRVDTIIDSTLRRR